MGQDEHYAARGGVERPTGAAEDNKEEPAMGKRLKKSEKLDLILLELAKLRDEVREFARYRAVKPKPRAAHGRSKRLSKLTGAGKNLDRGAAPAKRASVEAPQTPQPN